CVLLVRRPGRYSTLCPPIHSLPEGLHATSLREFPRLRSPTRLLTESRWRLYIHPPSTAGALCREQGKIERKRAASRGTFFMTLRVAKSLCFESGLKKLCVSLCSNRKTRRAETAVKRLNRYQ